MTTNGPNVYFELSEANVTRLNCIKVLLDWNMLKRNVRVNVLVT
jgi:hypothetical protein